MLESTNSLSKGKLREAFASRLINQRNEIPPLLVFRHLANSSNFQTNALGNDRAVVLFFSCFVGRFHLLSDSVLFFCMVRLCLMVFISLSNVRFDRLPRVRVALLRSADDVN